MFSLRAFFTPEFDSELLQKLVDRMARARWIVRSLVSPDPLLIEWSEKGLDRIAAIEKVLRRYMPWQFDGGSKKLGHFKYLMMDLKIKWLSKDLIPPQLSYAEGILLITVVIMDSHRKAGTTGPALPILTGRWASPSD